MSGTITNNPTTWSVEGNIISNYIGNPTSTTPFTPINCSLTLLTPVTIDGNILIPLKVVDDW